MRLLCWVYANTDVKILLIQNFAVEWKLGAHVKGIALFHRAEWISQIIHPVYLIRNSILFDSISQLNQFKFILLSNYKLIQVNSMHFINFPFLMFWLWEIPWPVKIKKISTSCFELYGVVRSCKQILINQKHIWNEILWR